MGHGFLYAREIVAREGPAVFAPFSRRALALFGELSLVGHELEQDAAAGALAMSTVFSAAPIYLCLDSSVS